MTTTYMGLDLAVVGTTIGPTYANQTNAALTLLDSHNHSSGQGVSIPTAGLNINADLSFNSKDASDLRASRYDSQASALGASVLRSVYSVLGDLYWNNENGTAVQVTNGTSVAGASGNISGMDATSALTYSTTTKVFTFTQSSGFPAKVACGDIQVFETVAAAGQAVTIKVPSGFSASYSLTLPAAVGATNTLLQMSSAGVLSAFAAPGGTSLLQQTSGGVLSWVTSLPSGLTIPSPTISTPTIADPTITGGITMNSVSLAFKVLEIGDWDMDASVSPSVDVVHGLTLSSIRAIECLVRNDAGNLWAHLNRGANSGDTTPQGYIGSADGTKVYINRLAGGYFDNTGYDSTGYNRGWVVIRYEAP